MTELRPLPISGQQQEGDWAALVAAKTALNLDYLIRPVVGLYGSPGRILALREPPAFLCDYALVREPSNQAAMQAAMAWVLDETIDDPRAVLLIDTLRGVFGDALTEIWDGPHFE